MEDVIHINVDNLNNVRHGLRRHMSRSGYLKAKSNELEQGVRTRILN